MFGSHVFVLVLLYLSLVPRAVPWYRTWDSPLSSIVVAFAYFFGHPISLLSTCDVFVKNNVCATLPFLMRVRCIALQFMSVVLRTPISRLSTRDVFCQEYCVRKLVACISCPRAMYLSVYRVRKFSDVRRISQYPFRQGMTYFVV